MSNTFLFWDIETYNVKDWSKESIEAVKMIAFCGELRNEESKTIEEIKLIIRDDNLTENLNIIKRNFDTASKLIAFNSDSFDWVVLQKYFTKEDFDRWFPKSIDFILPVKTLLGYHMGLENLCKANGVRLKTDVGTRAEVMFELEDYENLLKYCLNDCTMVRDLWDKDEIILPVKYGKDLILDLDYRNKFFKI